MERTPTLAILMPRWCNTCPSARSRPTSRCGLSLRIKMQERIRYQTLDEVKLQGVNKKDNYSIRTHTTIGVSAMTKRMSVTNCANCVGKICARRCSSQVTAKAGRDEQVEQNLHEWSSSQRRRGRQRGHGWHSANWDDYIWRKGELIYFEKKTQNKRQSIKCIRHRNTA